MFARIGSTWFLLHHNYGLEFVAIQAAKKTFLSVFANQATYHYILDFNGTVNDERPIESVLRLLSSHFWRTEHLAVSSDVQTRTFELLFYHLKTIAAPFLRTIAIARPAYTPHTLPELAEIFTGDVPALTGIHLRNISLLTCRLPLETVKFMYLTQVNPYQNSDSCEDWMTRISAATSLIHLQVEYITFVPDYWPGLGDSVCTITMPFLRSLCLRALTRNQYYVGPTEAFLTHITAPLLEVVIIKEHGLYLCDILILNPDNLPSLHTVVIWDCWMDGEEGGWRLFLGGRFPDLQNFTCGGICEADCKSLLTALSLYDDKDPSERRESETNEDDENEEADDNEDRHGAGEEADSDDIECRRGRIRRTKAQNPPKT